MGLHLGLSNPPCYGDETERALLRAVKRAAREFKAASPEQRAAARESYRRALRAFAMHIHGGVGGCPSCAILVEQMQATVQRMDAGLRELRELKTDNAALLGALRRVEALHGACVQAVSEYK